MKRIIYGLYNGVCIPLLWLGYHLAGLFDRKVRIGVKGRKNLFSELKRQVNKLPENYPRFWIHTSSMGEFEQAKPVISALKKKYNACVVAVTLFSPSAMENIKDYREADILCYLPFDSSRSARRFVSIIRPDVAIVVRHDIWPNHMIAARRQNVPTLLINTSIQHPERFTNPFIRMIYSFLFDLFDYVLTVSKESGDAYLTYRLGNGLTEHVGDTRYDQVIRRAKEAEPIVSPLRTLKGGRKCFVAGSTWPSDESVIFEAMEKLKQSNILPWVVMVPHEPVKEHIDHIESQLNQMHIPYARISQKDKLSDHIQVLLVDQIGILASLYALADLTFVGGGFGPGIHNVLEPAAFGKAVLFGPRHKNSYEAGLLKESGTGIAVQNGDALFKELYELLLDPDKLKIIGERSANMVNSNRGATDRILHRLELILKSK